MFQLVLPFDFGENFYSSPLELCTGFFHNIPTLAVKTPLDEAYEKQGFIIPSINDLLPQLNHYLHNNPEAIFKQKQDQFFSSPFTRTVEQLLEKSL